MKYIIRIILISFFISSIAFADKLEIKVDGKSINLSHWPAQREHYGAVLIINGGGQAQALTLLDHLADQLSQNGWFVVLLDNDIKSSVPWIKQLPEALTALHQQNNTRIIILHYGEQLAQTLSYLSKSSSEITGLILLSAYDIPASSKKLPELKIPVFDIVGQFDYDLVKQAIAVRKKEFSDNEKGYLTLQLPGASHDYAYSQQLLCSFIHGWMLKLPEFQSKESAPLISYLYPIILNSIAEFRINAVES